MITYGVRQTPFFRLWRKDRIFEMGGQNRTMIFESFPAQG